MVLVLGIGMVQETAQGGLGVETLTEEILVRREICERTR